ncbi:MAG: hypothetical protein J6Y02_13855, partial [Pseudobutyrivibrio sp.]|nr:hypothetical protein [Pseudobutyrivibrio sp.]
MFDLNKYASNIAVETEQGKKMTYAQLKEDADSIAAEMEPRKFTFCLCENTLGSFVGYVAFMMHNIPTVLLDASKESSVIGSLIEHYKPTYIWKPKNSHTEILRLDGSKRPKVERTDHTDVILTYEDYVLVKTNYEEYE